MRRIASPLLALSLALNVAAPPLLAAAPEPAVSDAHAALLTLNRAADALGGADRLAQAPSLSLDYRGEINWLDQGRTPSDVMTLRLRQETHFDWTERQVLVRLDLAGPESSFQQRAAFHERPGQDDLIYVAALSPHAIVRELLSEPRSLLLLNAGAEGETLAGSYFGRMVSVTIGPDHLPRQLRYFTGDDIQGDIVRVVEYLDYTGHGEWQVPQRVRQLDGGRLTHDLRLSAFAPRVDRPDWTAGLAPRPPAAAGTAPVAGLEPVELAPGIHLLRGHAGADYHGMLVELEDGLMILETPDRIGDGSELRRVAASISPKPIVYAVPTHHHGDHAGGAAVLARQGVKILTTPGNVQFFTGMAEKPRLFSGERSAAADPKVRALAPAERIGPVQFLDISSAEHAAEHLVFYFPDHGILFQSDMGRFNPDGSVEPGRPQTCALLDQIESRGLKVNQIIGGHGRPGTMDDLRRATALPEAPCHRQLPIRPRPDVQPTNEPEGN